MTETPWDFGTAVDRCQRASQRQVEQEESTIAAYRDYAEKKKAHYLARAKKILELRAEGMAITACMDVAKGDSEVAKLGYARDISEGVMEAAKQAGWRRNADRKDAQRFSDWSQNRELAEFRGRDPETPTYTKPIGVRG